MAFGQERTPKTPKTRICGSSHCIREDAGVCLLAYSAHTSLMVPKSPRKIPKHSASLAEVPPLLSATSECGLYLRFARAIGLLPPTDRFMRATTEGSALDSFQNMLFSVARFRELTGAYPARITVVGHDFKRRRFGQPHPRALRWPKHHFIHLGIPLGAEADERQEASGEVVIFFLRDLSTT
ncbi:hypothetical protein EDB86DRAFT_3167331 [Lactarius hatsudake]|nr:hypothetical protein EDB86DRAFT_3167331 [Lactarius hatsudake]